MTFFDNPSELLSPTIPQQNHQPRKWQSQIRGPYEKEIFLSVLLISLLALAAAKPVQADTSVADIQKRGVSWLLVWNKTFLNFGYSDPKTGTYSGIETDLAKMW